MKAFERRIGQAIILGVSLSAVSPALAQMNPIILAGPQNNAMGQIMALRSKQMQQQFDQRSASRAGAEVPMPETRVSPSLVISSDPAVTRRVHDLYIDGLTQSSGAAQASQVDERLGNIRITFARMVGSYGLRADNLDDVMAAHIIVMWMAANQRSRLPTPVQVQAVRRQMRNVFASGAGVISDATERQSAAEYVMYETCMTVLVRNELRLRPDLDKRISDAVDMKMAEQGYALRDLKLTDQGLIKG